MAVYRGSAISLQKFTVPYNLYLPGLLGKGRKPGSKWRDMVNRGTMYSGFTGHRMLWLIIVAVIPDSRSSKLNVSLEQ